MSKTSNRLSKLIRNYAESKGIAINSASNISRSVELTEVDLRHLRYIQDNNLTMLSEHRLVSLILTCKQVDSLGLRGDFVECGVWRGGASLLARLTFDSLGSDRRVLLFDTFAGMTEPSVKDMKFGEVSSEKSLNKFHRLNRDEGNDWNYASLDEVKNSFVVAGVNMDSVKFIEGDVRKTLLIGKNLPKHISVLRLDTDFYDSTLLELEVLYPLLEVGSPLILDDYGSWAGAKEAVDEFFSGGSFPRPLLYADDKSCRTGIKIG